MSRFDRRLKGANTKKPGSGAACVPQPIPKRAPLLAGMMFSGRTIGTSRATQNLRSTSNSSTEQTLDSLVNQVGSNITTNNTEKMSSNNI